MYGVGNGPLITRDSNKVTSTGCSSHARGCSTFDVLTMPDPVDKAVS